MDNADFYKREGIPNATISAGHRLDY